MAERDRPEPNYTTGVLAKYGATFGSAANGAVTNPGVKRGEALLATGDVAGKMS